MQVDRQKIRNYLIVPVCYAMLFALCFFGMVACGKMPSGVDLYPGVTAESYRQAYPDPTTDPSPRYNP